MTVDKARLALLNAALRSDEFKQGTGALLRRKGGQVTFNPEVATKHCCLGVANVIAVRNGYVGEIQWSLSALSEGVRDWYGFRDSDPRVSKAAAEAAEIDHSCECCDDRQSATTLNDVRRASFAQIATAFEYEYIRDSDS